MGAAQLSPSLPIRLASGFGLAIAVFAFVAVPLAVENGYTPSPVGDLVRAAGDSLKPDTQFALVDFKEPTAVWEMRRVMSGYAQFVSEDDFLSYLDQPGSRAIICTSELYDRLKFLTPHPNGRPSKCPASTPRRENRSISR